MNKRIKRTSSILLAVCLLVGTVLLISGCGSKTVNLTVADGKPANGFLWEHNYSEITITGYVGDTNDLVIPSKINHKPVTTIAAKSFTGYSAMKTVNIPDSVTSIGNSAFSGCTSLTNIKIGAGLKSLDGFSFEAYGSLKSIDVSENNPKYRSIDGNLYSKDGKTLLHYAIGKTATRFTIPDGVTSIGDGAFRGCTALSSVTIPNSVTSIEASAFEGCTRLTSLTIPSGVKSIGWYAFSGCTALTSITIPSSVTSIGSLTFWYCLQLTDITYTGTKAQWNAISKGSFWGPSFSSGGLPWSADISIHCTDGYIKE